MTKIFQAVALAARVSIATVTLSVLVAVVQCATLPAPKPTSTDAGAESPPTDCDVVCEKAATMKCKFASECPSVCRLLKNPDLIKCLKGAQDCLTADGCNIAK
jgi:hypothetical protein